MTNNASFVRKVIYITAIAVLLMPLAYLSQPAVFVKSDASTGATTTQGGKLANLRRDYGMSQAELGDIDPASDSMRLALFGLDGVAANILWIMAHEYKKKKNWEAVDATTKQIVKLQPHFKSVWDFQAHNLSYNISVEFDNYEHRYLWVKKGIEFLIEGSRKNRGEPILYWHLGWYTGQKLGISDEKLQFRRLYRTDHDFHNQFRENGIDVDEARGPDGKPDNWFTAHLWFVKGRFFADERGRPIRGKSPLIFHNQPAMTIINGSSAMEKEGHLGDFAISKWRAASEEYDKFGSRPIPTSWGENIKLNDLEAILDRIKQTEAALDALAPGEREKQKEAKKAKLTANDREVLDKPEDKRSAAELVQARELESLLLVRNNEIAAKAPPENRLKAYQLADQIQVDEMTAQRIRSYRGIVNFDYWRDRCQAEQLQDSLTARDHLFKAEEAFRKTDLTTAKKEYEESFAAWSRVYKKYPVLMDNAESQDLIDSCVRYSDVLGQLDLEFPADFALNDLLGLFDDGKRLKALQAKKPKATEPEPEKGTDPKTPATPSSEEKKPEESKPAEGGKPAENAKPADESKPTAASPTEEGKPASETKKVDPPAENKPATPTGEAPAGKIEKENPSI